MIEYFTHDYSARNDIKLKKLFMKEGLKGIGLYWCLIEMLYERSGYIELDYIPIIAFDMREDEEFVRRVITEYELFEQDETRFYSSGINKRLQVRQEKSDKARKSAGARWAQDEEQAESERNATAMRTQCDRNANELRPQCERTPKVKEKEKEKEKLLRCSSKEKKENSFTDDYDDFIKKYQIGVDNYSEQVVSMDFKALSAAYAESKWLQENIVSLSRICKEYEKIISGYYKDFKGGGNKPVSTFGVKTHDYTKEDYKSLAVDIDDLEL